MLEHALQYAKFGWPVFPCHTLIPGHGCSCKRSDCQQIAKHPRTAHGVKDATTDPEKITNWWTQWPDANIAIATSQKLAVLDLDVRDDRNGFESTRNYQLPETVEARTGGDGAHYFLTLSKPTKNITDLLPGVDIKTEGGYVIAAPSLHRSGQRYAWVEDGEVQPAPQWLENLVANFKHKKSQPEIKEGKRNETLFKHACSLRARGKNEQEILEQLTLKNQACHPPLTQSDLEQIAASSCRYDAGTVNNDNKRFSEDVVQELSKKILDEKFKIFVSGEADLIFEIKDLARKEVQIVTNDNYILRPLRSGIIEEMSQIPSINNLDKIYRTWQICSEPIKMPSSFCWRDQDEWTFKKLDFVPTDGPYPAWQEFLDRLSSPEDFKAFIWSVFEQKSQSRQYLYLFDPYGQGGKSTVIRVLGNILGNSYSAINKSFVSEGSSRWLMGHILGKRLVTWPDCKNPKFCMSEILRNITSGDEVPVEFKGKKGFNAKMYVKFIMASNHEPEITGGGADVSRLIRIDVSENKSSKNDPLWEQKIIAELPFFLNACRHSYEKKCPNHGDLTLDDKTIESVADSSLMNESRWEVIVSKYFSFQSDYECTMESWVELCKLERLNSLEVGNLKDYILQNYGVGFKRKGKKQISYLRGARIRVASTHPQDDYGP